jgi:hypothetical protein
MFEFCVRNLNHDTLRDFVDYGGGYSATRAEEIACEIAAARPRGMSFCDASRERLGGISHKDGCLQSHACDALLNWLDAARRDVVDEATAIFVLATWAAAVERHHLVDMFLAGAVLSNLANEPCAAFIADLTCDDQSISRCCCHVIRSSAAACDACDTDQSALPRALDVLMDHGIIVRSAKDAGVDISSRPRVIARRWGIDGFELPIRQLTADERRLLAHFFAALAAHGVLASTDMNWLRVRDMDDGGMGSLALLDANGHRGKFDKCVAELQYTDTDGSPVLVSIYLGKDGRPMELDSWRIGDGPRHHIPPVLPAVSVYPDGQLPRG